MMTTTDQLARDYEHLRDTASAAAAAAQDLARAANHGVIPAPAAYEILGIIKLLLWHLQEVIDHLPTGLQQSLHEAAIEIYDRDPRDGTPRDPVLQQAIAGAELEALLAHLNAGATAAEAAQSALNSQGYQERQP